MRGYRFIGFAVIGCVLTIVAPSAASARGLVTGIGDQNYVFAGSAAQRSSLFDRTVEANAGMVRLHARWRSIAAGSEPASPANPADPAYDFSRLDAAVVAASQRNLDVMLMIFDAPAWAEGPNRPPISDSVRAGTWKPEPMKLRGFARAVATRYSGSFADLPRVRRFQVWNEQNLFAYLTPQYERSRLVAPKHYVRMLNAAYRGIKAVRRSNVVVTGGTAPYGDPAPGRRTRPLKFWRKALCLGGRRLEGRRCSPKAKFDVLAHHPINLSGGPGQKAVHADDAATPDLGKIRRTLRAAERERTLATRGRHPLWATEFWWQSRPPVDNAVPAGKHGRWYQQTLYSLWRQGAAVAMILQVADTTNAGDLQTGLYYADGTPKPALRAFRFPFIPDRRSNGREVAWGRAPATGKLMIERRSAGAWRRVKTLQVKDGRVFLAKLEVSGRPKMRARIGTEKSLATKLG